MASRFIRFQPGRAYRAARIVAGDPDQLTQVFALLDSLSGDTLYRLARRLEKSEHGRKMFATRPDIVDRLADRQALARLPEGSLGRAYLDFVESEHISAEGIRAAAAAGTENAPPAPFDFVHARMRDTHDLWHAAVGYHGDVLGEAALLAFTLAQTWNPAIALLIAIGLVKLHDHPAARAVILDGFRRGRQAAWLPEQDWESLLALPVTEVRRRLSLEAPPVYTEIRSSVLKAQAQAA